MGKRFRRLRNIFHAVSASSLMLVGGCATPGGLQGRPLTPGEKDMARGVFGDTIDYDKIKIYNGPPTVAGIFQLKQNKLSAITPNGDIYLVGEDCKQPDLSQASEANRKLLIHEMTHVWQHQQGRNVEREAIFLFIKSGFNYDSCYAYDINGKEKFVQLNLEQQAHMVEDYFALRDTPLQPWENAAERQEKIAKFEAMLKPCLPIANTSTNTTAAPPPKAKPAEPK
ncbi:MAG: DUF4157 domain-containing protein [Alphaproteobacteria bacterium]|nr:MAG: DUF4157 domain-containing protein [Alphaproteobacteria bacterium]